MKFLVIQTAFIGDAILATAVLEKLHDYFPDAGISILVRKGNETLFTGHPYLKKVHVWDKKKHKLSNLFHTIDEIRAEQYDTIINLHRFASSGFLCALSGAKKKIGFDKNPLSFLFTTKVKHEIGKGVHEVERNQKLIEALTDEQSSKPKLYPSSADLRRTTEFKTGTYVCIAPTSVWFTKQFPQKKWVELCEAIGTDTKIFLLGAPSDLSACEEIIAASKNKNIVNLCGKLSFLESAALMKDARMNYVNDSAPMHIASSMDAPTTAIYCSTVPAFGFGPLSTRSRVVETKLPLKCRPCGLHGHKACPLGHFECAQSIEIIEVLGSDN